MAGHRVLVLPSTFPALPAMRKGTSEGFKGSWACRGIAWRWTFSGLQRLLGVGMGHSKGGCGGSVEGPAEVSTELQAAHGAIVTCTGAALLWKGHGTAWTAAQRPGPRHLLGAMKMMKIMMMKIMMMREMDEMTLD